jgi:hypothetical protein
MSADAKVWQDTAGRWCGLHDGDCRESSIADHPVTLGHYDLREVLEGIELCMGGRPLRWELFRYTNGEIGLRGYQT